MLKVHITNVAIISAAALFRGDQYLLYANLLER